MAKQRGVSTDDTAPPVEGYDESYRRSASEIAARAVVLQGAVAVACGVDPEWVIDWLRENALWETATPMERAFLAETEPLEEDQRRFRWRQEAEWTLLWMIDAVPSLGLPTRCCDTRKLVDEIIPALGSDVSPFISSAQLRAPSELLAEDDRTYNLWCYAALARREGKPLPEDLNLSVLFERRYAFQWLDGEDDWDDVQCDA